MSKSSRLAVVVLLIAAGACIVGWNLFKANESNTPSVTDEPLRPKGREFLSMSENSQNTSIPDINASMTDKTDSINPLHRALLAAKDLRVLSEKLKNQPEDGGLYYAAVINQRCSGINDRLAANLSTDSNTSHELATKREASLNKLRGQCQGFLNSELSVEELATLYKSSKKDPLMNIATQLSNAINSGTVDQKRSALTALINAKSPELMNAKLIIYNEKGPYFNGISYTIGENGSAFLLTSAVALAQCKLGGECDANDFAVLNACATEMICAENKEELIKKRVQLMSKNPGADMDKINVLTDQLVVALKNKDVDKFIPR